MNESHIILLLIIIILILLILHGIYKKYIEKLSENTYDEGQIYENDTSIDNNLLIPTKNMVYNPYDIHRPANDLPIQEQSIESESDLLSKNINTSGDTPIVYSLDVLSHTVYNTPTQQNLLPDIDTGSGAISKDIEINNTKSVTFSSIN
jgi:hypothetical protein